MSSLEFQKQPEKGSTTLTLRLPKVVNQQLEEIAKETGISKNAIVNKMILYGIANMKIID